MIERLQNNDLVITRNKRVLLKNLNESKKLLALRIMDLEEFKKRYFGTYKKEAIYYLISKYHDKFEIAKMYLDNFYFLNDLKKELEDHHLIEIEPLFKTSIQRIVVFGYPDIDAYLKEEIKKYDSLFLNEAKNHYLPKVYQFDDIEEEINDIALNILNLLKCVNIQQIKLVNVGKEYEIPLKRIFDLYHIPVCLNSKKNLYGLETTQRFIKNLKITKSIEEALQSFEQDDIYYAILSICNEYQFHELDDGMIYCIEEELKSAKLSAPKLEDAIEIIDISDIDSEEEYYFIVGLNQGVLPKTYQDEDYLSDAKKSKLGILTSLEKNKLEKKFVQEKITSYPNIYLTYKLKSAFETFYPSPLIEDLHLEVIKKENADYTHSNLYNKLILSKELDKFIKYNEYTPDLELLYHHYPSLEYLKYHNQYQKIDSNQFLKLIDHKLLLSYSSLDNYYRCGFRYYLTNILKLNQYEETFMTYIGNLFHYILSKAFTNSFDFEQEFKNYIENKEFTPKESFFIQKLKKDLLFTIETIKKQDQDTLLKNALYEQKIYINKDRNIKITFMGIIDKLKYEKYDGKTVVAIIDYKTGNPNIHLNNAIYGLEMQLPIYLYLAKNSKLENVEIGGFYLQKIVHNKQNFESNKDSNQELEKKYRLEGYSTNEENILSLVDRNYTDSHMIKGMKTSSKGFYAYTKVLSKENMDTLEQLVDNKIEEAIDHILDVDFKINPKKIGQDLIGCEFCQFQDICYKKEEDIVALKEQNYQDFLGGEIDA